MQIRFEYADTEKTKTKGYYEAKGMTRFTFIIGKQHKDKLKELSKQFKITQSTVIEALLDEIDIEKMTPVFESKAQKNSTRISKPVKQRDVIDALKGMTPDQLTAALAAVSGLKEKSE